MTILASGAETVGNDKNDKLTLDDLIVDRDRPPLSPRQCVVTLDDLVEVLESMGAKRVVTNGTHFWTSTDASFGVRSLAWEPGTYLVLRLEDDEELS